MSETPVEILIVEDSLTQLMMLQNILEKNGFRVHSAGNGKKALAKLGEIPPPAVVITDIQMPEMDGYELCTALKNDPQRRALPVMLLTSLSAPQDIIRGLECGADNFVVKPYEEKFLLSRIETILANQQLRKSAGGNDEVPIYFAGQRYVITSDRRQILNLLLSTYETAVKTNLELIKAHEELKTAQAQLIEAEKLQSVGRLAAGVAHEVRNPLAILEMGVTLLSEKPGLPEDDKVVLDEMREAVKRANFVITGLMDLSSPRELGMREVEVNAFLDDTLHVFASQITQQHIEVVREFANECCSVRIDPSKMEQAFLNVIANARDAMPEGGTLTVRTRGVTLSKEDVAFDAGDRSGGRLRENDRVVVIELADTGSGIAAENQGKLFEPFFSTRPTGKGMGLGLTVAKKIVDLHGGRIAIRNGPAGGAVAEIILKCAPAAGAVQ